MPYHINFRRQNPNPPNAEQTASPITFLLFIFMDSLVYAGYKHPHLPFDLLPSLCDYDRSAYLHEISHEKIRPPPEMKRRSLGIRIVSFYRKPYSSPWIRSCATLNIDCYY